MHRHAKVNDLRAENACPSLPCHAVPSLSFHPVPCQALPPTCRLLNSSSSSLSTKATRLPHTRTSVPSAGSSVRSSLLGSKFSSTYKCRAQAIRKMTAVMHAANVAFL